MSTYKFQLEDFALSEEGVHLVRNQFNFKTIGYEQIQKVTIERSTEIKNAPLILLIGISLVCFSFYQSRWIVDMFTRPGAQVKQTVLVYNYPNHRTGKTEKFISRLYQRSAFTFI